MCICALFSGAKSVGRCALERNEVSRIYEVLSRMGLIQDLDDLALELGTTVRFIKRPTLFNGISVCSVPRN